MARTLRECVFAAIGTLVGLYAGAIAGGLIGAGLASLLMSSGGLETLGPAVVGLVIGGVAGAAGGCWLALRLAAAERPGLTALLTLPILAITVIAAQVLADVPVLRAQGVAAPLIAAAAGVLARVIVLVTMGRASRI